MNKKSHLIDTPISAKQAMAAFEQYTNFAHRDGPRPELKRPERSDDPDVVVLSHIVQAEEEITQLRDAVRVLGAELRVWRNAPHIDHVLSSYWADLPLPEKLVILAGSDVFNNPIAAAAVKGNQ